MQVTQANNQTETTAATPRQADAFEKFIERVTEDAKLRPLVANVGVVLMGLFAMSSLAALPSMFGAFSSLGDLARMQAEIGSDAEMGALGTQLKHASATAAMAMTFVSALSVVGLAANVAATMGLYKMRRVGVYAVAAATAQALVLGTMTGGSTIGSALMTGTLFYFLWNEREKFA